MQQVAAKINIILCKCLLQDKKHLKSKTINYTIRSNLAKESQKQRNTNLDYSQNTAVEPQAIRLSFTYNLLQRGTTAILLTAEAMNHQKELTIFCSPN